MALIVLTSAAGAPGVTSTVVGLAALWPRSVLVVDADPGAFQSVLAGFLRGQIATGKGLVRVAEAHRDRRPLTEVISDQTIPLSEGSAGRAEDHDHLRRLLPGFVHPANAALFAPVWPALADALVRYEAAGIDVLLDAGRLDREGLPQPLLDRADLVLTVLRSDLRSVAACRRYVAGLREQAMVAGSEAGLGLLLVGEGHPYGRREISRLLGLPVLSVVARDVESAAVYSDGAVRPRRFDRSPLNRSLRGVIDDLRAGVDQRRRRLGLEDESQLGGAGWPTEDAAEPSPTDSTPAMPTTAGSSTARSQVGAAVGGVPGGEFGA